MWNPPDLAAPNLPPAEGSCSCSLSANSLVYLCFIFHDFKESLFTFILGDLKLHYFKMNHYTCEVRQLYEDPTSLRVKTRFEGYSGYIGNSVVMLKVHVRGCVCVCVWWEVIWSPFTSQLSENHFFPFSLKSIPLSLSLSLSLSSSLHT